MRNRASLHGHRDETGLRLLGGLADGIRDIVSLSEAIADPAITITNDDERGEREVLTTLDDLGYAVDLDQLLYVSVLDFLIFYLTPAERAPSAMAFTIP